MKLINNALINLKNAYSLKKPFIKLVSSTKVISLCEKLQERNYLGTLIKTNNSKELIYQLIYLNNNFENTYALEIKDKNYNTNKNNNKNNNKIKTIPKNKYSALINIKLFTNKIKIYSTKKLKENNFMEFNKDFDYLFSTSIGFLYLDEMVKLNKGGLLICMIN